MKEFVFGNIRVQVLSRDIIRLECAKNGKFCDRDTFFVSDRKSLEGSVETHATGNKVAVGEYVVTVPEGAKTLDGVTLSRGGKVIYAYEKLKNSGTLPKLGKTPEVFALSDTPRIFVPEGGYSAERKGEYYIAGKVQDIYLLLCGGDAKKLRRLYVQVAGRPELVRLSTLGSWNSKYYPYTQEEAKQLILDYENHDVPLDVMVIDTDWRSCERGWGYDINTELFPDMKGFIDFAHSHNVEIMFNDHPEPVDGADVFKPEEIAYREKNLRSLMDMGLDIWWYDRNWTTSLVSPTRKIRWETFGLYLFSDITANYYKKQGSDGVYRRPVVMGNVVNVHNGEYLGITDSASHRYSIQWTGDIGSSADVLAGEIENMLDCSDNCVSYVNFDCGGHTGSPYRDLFIRWMQFGSLSPIYRPHCTANLPKTREPWVFDEEALDIVREYVKLRYRLLPVIYKNAYNSYLTGEPIFKSLYYEFPDDRRVAKLRSQYMLGNSIIISPVSGERAVRLSKSDYTAPVKAEFFNGRELKGEPIARCEWSKLHMSLDREPPVEGVPIYDFSARFTTKIKFDFPVKLFIKSDDGVTVKLDGKTVLEDKTCHCATTFELGNIEEGREHDLEIEYFQALGEAFCGLYYVKTDVILPTKTYLPVGCDWVDVFSGSVIRGGKSAERFYPIEQMPIFVRKGAVIPLAFDANNTKLQKWDRLLFDYYADKHAGDSGYLYEDDTETTAYKFGECRKSEYRAKYDKKAGAYVFALDAAVGTFKGDRCFDKREISVKLHIPAGEKMTAVTVNGKDADSETFAVDLDAFPFNAGKTALDSDTAFVTFTADVDKPVTVMFKTEQ